MTLQEITYNLYYNGQAWWARFSVQNWNL